MLDRGVEETSGKFGERIRELRPDAVIDLTCYGLESAQHLVENLRGHISQFLRCGTIWVHGVAVEVPITEDRPREPFGDYVERSQSKRTCSRKLAAMVSLQPFCTPAI